MTILAVVPTKPEFDALVDAFTEHGYRTQERTIGRLAGLYLDSTRLLLARGGLGKAQFAVHTQHLLDYLQNIDLVMCIGAAGGIHPHVAIGDVVVSTSTIEHDVRFGFPTTKPLPQFEGHGPSLAMLKEIGPALDGSFKMHFGPVASGDEGVVNAVRASELHRATGALACAWEGAGGARAASFNELPFVEVRGISGLANEDASSDFTANVPKAMRNVVAMLNLFMPKFHAMINEARSPTPRA